MDWTDWNGAVRRAIDAKRQTGGFTFRSLAAEMHVTRDWVWQRLRGKTTELTLLDIARFGEVLEFDPEQLISDELARLRASSDC